MITSRTPDTWQDLQLAVQTILSNCGFDVELEKTIETVRGKVEVDVFAEETVKGRKYTILCECKHWKSRVPKQIVHGFRSVVGDFGANVGYIISMNGFQSGAFDAAELTNLELVDWIQFQSAFEETWFDEYLSPTIAEELDPLLTYAEPILPAWFKDLSESQKKQFVGLKNKYDELGWLVMMFTPYPRMGRDAPRPELPVRGRLPDESNIPAAILDAVGYREFYEGCLEHGREAIREFRSLKPSNSV